MAGAKDQGHQTVSSTKHLAIDIKRRYHSVVTRILADLHDDDIQRLDRMAAAQGTSRAAMLREAVQLYLLHRGDDRSWIERGYGLWADRQDIRDNLDHQRASRVDRQPHEGS
jgi:hypothetical protein